MYLEVVNFECIFLEVFWASWICKFISFPVPGIHSYCFFKSIFCINLFVFDFCDSSDTNFISSAIIQQANFYSSVWVISTDLFSNLYTPLLFPFCYRAPLSECFISDIVLLCCKISIWSFLQASPAPNQNFYFFIHFKNVYLTTWGMVIMAALTCLPDNSS